MQFRFRCAAVLTAVLLCSAAALPALAEETATPETADSVVSASTYTGWKTVNGKDYMVNESGKVQTNEKAYKSDGDYVYLVEDREVYYTDDNGKKTKKADSSATLPDFTCDQVYEL